MIAPTHRELVALATRFLKRQARCSIVAAELYTSANCVPDAIGWRAGRFSTVIECKTSRSDFLRDAKKWHRRADYQCGNERYFLTRAGLLTSDEIPQGWGLLEFDGRSITIAKAAPFDVNPSRRDELIILCSIIRRARTKARVSA